MYSKENKNEF